MDHPIPLDGFIQIALVVDDIENGIESWCTLFDAPRPDIRITKPEPNPDEKYRGETPAYGLKLAVIEVPERGFIIELHEPDENPSTFREFLDKHGNGLHHLGFQVGNARDAVHAGELVATCSAQQRYEFQLTVAPPGARRHRGAHLSDRPLKATR